MSLKKLSNLLTDVKGCKMPSVICLFLVCQVVKMLIAVVTIFATLWLPHRGMLVYNTVASLRGQ